MKKSMFLCALAAFMLTVATALHAIGDIADEYLNDYLHQQQLNAAARRELWNLDELNRLLSQGAQLPCEELIRQASWGGITEYDVIFNEFQQCMEKDQKLFRFSSKVFTKLFEDGYVFNFELWQHVAEMLREDKENRNMLAAIRDKFQDTWSPEEQQLSAKKMQNFAAIERGKRVEKHINNLYWRRRDANGTDDISQQHNMHKLGRLLNKGAIDAQGRDYCGEIRGLLANITSTADNEMIFDYFEQCMRNSQYKPSLDDLDLVVIKKLESRGFVFSFAHWRRAFDAIIHSHNLKEVASIMYASHDTWSEEEQAGAKKIKANWKADKAYCKIFSIDRVYREPIKQDPTLDIQSLLAKLVRAFNEGAELGCKSTIKILAAYPDLIQCESIKRFLEHTMSNNYDEILSRWGGVEAEPLLKAVQILHAHGYTFTQEQLLKTIAWKDGYMNYVTTKDIDSLLYPAGLSRNWVANRLKNLKHDLAAYQEIIYVIAESVAR